MASSTPMPIAMLEMSVVAMSSGMPSQPMTPKFSVSPTAVVTMPKKPAAGERKIAAASSQIGMIAVAMERMSPFTM